MARRTAKASRARKASRRRASAPGSTAIVRDNERSFVSKLATAATLRVSEFRHVKTLRADATLSADEGNRYPDLLLCTEASSATILQNWEFKFPDTSIDDSAFFENAKMKSQLLLTHSFVLSNLQETRLYTRQPNGENSLKKTWRYSALIERGTVTANENAINEHFHGILKDIDLFFSNGELASPATPTQYIPSLISSFIAVNRDPYAVFLDGEAGHDAVLKQQIDNWWAISAGEYGSSTSQMAAYASQVAFQLSSTVFFLHCVAEPSGIRAKLAVFGARPTTPLLVEMCQRATHAVDYNNILGGTSVFDRLSNTLLERAGDLSRFLDTLCIADVPRAELRNPITAILTRDSRRIIGHFSTPMPVAEFMVALAAPMPKEESIDPCCGSGTIFEALREHLHAAGATRAQSARHTWASDKFALPVYMTTLRAADPANYDVPLRIFRKDCLDIQVGDRLVFHKPENHNVTARVPAFDCIVSNLPFIRFEHKTLSSLAASTSASALASIQAAHAELDHRIDAYAVLIFHLANLLEDSGRIVVLTSNSWLGVQWGRLFQMKLLRHFRIELVIMEGRHHWFQDAEVRCTILVLRKRQPSDHKKAITFARPIIPFDQSPVAFVRELASDVHCEKPQHFEAHKRTEADLLRSDSRGATWRLAFYDQSWLDAVAKKTTLASNVFPNIGRGIRGGNNNLFYPRNGSGIESTYLRPLIKDNKDHRLKVRPHPTKKAFVCNRTERHLRLHGHTGTLSWIQRHEARRSQSERPGYRWYYLGAPAKTQFVTTLNPDDVFIFAALARRAVVDQRMILFGGASVDVALTHALLNSLITFVWLEQRGFARAEGALDLNVTGIKEHLRMPDPDAIAPTEKRAIVSLFKVLRGRRVRPVSEELYLPDREAFDLAILRALGLGKWHAKLRDVLIAMVEDRVAKRGG